MKPPGRYGRQGRWWSQWRNQPAYYFSKEAKMMRFLKLLVILAVSAAFAAGPAYATQPGQTVNPNGFPSGEHYNLNILGKKDGFACEPQVDALGNPVYGKVVFVPLNGNNIQILMQSGAGKKAADITTFQVTDPCTASIDGDAAIVQIPKNDKGYKVYARTLAKPTGSPSMEIVPELVAVEDEFGNDLVYLGLVTSTGFQTPYSSFSRTKGKSTAQDITGLFEWSGSICYFSSTYCTDACTTTTLCCIAGAVAGTYGSCVPKIDFCPLGTVEVSAYCKTYTDEWVFSIGDFVTYLWSMENNGVRNLQVRFYPVM